MLRYHAHRLAAVALMAAADHTDMLACDADARGWFVFSTRLDRAVDWLAAQADRHIASAEAAATAARDGAVNGAYRLADWTACTEVADAALARYRRRMAVLDHMKWGNA